MANLASYKGRVYITAYNGTSTTGEACSNVSGKIYQMDDATKQLMDPSVAVVVKDNGSTVSSGDISSIDYLFGKVTFDAGYTVTGPVTIDCDYLARTDVAEVVGADINISMESLELSPWGNAYKTFIPGQISADLSFEVRSTGTQNIDTTEDITDLVQDGRLLCVEWQMDRDNTTTVTVNRAYGFFTGLEYSASQGSVLSHTLTFQVASVTSVEGYTVAFSTDTL